MSSTTATHPSFPFSRTDTYHPAPENAYLREHAPVTKVTLFDGHQAWALTKHGDIKAALSSTHLSADRRSQGFPEIHEGGKKAKDEKPTFVNLDDPEHKQQRNMLQDAFEPKAVEKYKPMMQEVIDRVLDKMVGDHKDGKKSFDLIEEFATPVPTQIIYSILGVPKEDVEELSKDSSVRTGTSRTAAEQANESLDKYMRNLVKKLIDSPTDGLISKLIEDQYKQGTISEDDVVQLAFLILTAGNAALINSIGLGMLTLFEHPKQLEELKKSVQQDQYSGLLKSAVVEMLRWNTTSALNSRRAVKEDTEFHGQRVKKGESVVCAVQAGDRDEDVTSNAETFDIHRQYNFPDLLAFGYGPHRCQAEHFSRVELEVAFSSLLRRCPNLTLAAKADELPYTPPTQNVGVTKLPVELR